MAQTLTSKQRAQLRGLAHPLKATVQVGKEGVTLALLESIRQALANRELLKVKVLESAGLDVRTAAAQIQEAIPSVQTVQTMGRIATLYRPDPDDPKIKLS